jgi:hypothetical protein
MSPTPSPVEPPSPENVDAYRAAALAYRKAWRVERVKGMKANYHVPLDTAALAVQAIRPGWDYDRAWTFAQRAVAWAGQAHTAWLRS